MEAWGFKNEIAFSSPRYALLQITRNAQDPESHQSAPLMRPCDVEHPNTDADWPQNISDIELCTLNENGSLDTSSLGYSHPIRLRIDPSLLNYQWAQIDDPTVENDFISQDMWRNFNLTSDNGHYIHYETRQGQPTHTRAQFEPCRLTTSSGDQQRHRIFLTQGHHRLRTCESMPNPSLFSEIPEHPGFNFSDALRVSSHIPDGMACFSAPHGAQRLRRLSINGNSNTALGSLRPFLNWVLQPGGLSSRGVDEWHIFGDYHWDAVDSDHNALVMAQGLVSLLQVQLHGESQLTFSGVTQFISHTIQAILIPVGAVVSTAIGLWILLRKDGFLARRQARINAEEMQAAQKGSPIYSWKDGVEFLTDKYRNRPIYHFSYYDRFNSEVRNRMAQFSKRNIFIGGPSRSGKGLYIEVDLLPRIMSGDIPIPYVATRSDGSLYHIPNRPIDIWCIREESLRPAGGSYDGAAGNIILGALMEAKRVAEANQQIVVVRLPEADIVNQPTSTPQPGQPPRTIAQTMLEFSQNNPNVIIVEDTARPRNVADHINSRDMLGRMLQLELIPSTPQELRQFVEFQIAYNNNGQDIRLQLSDEPINALVTLGADYGTLCTPSSNEELLNNVGVVLRKRAPAGTQEINVSLEDILQVYAEKKRITIDQARAVYHSRHSNAASFQGLLDSNFYRAYTEPYLERVERSRNAAVVTPNQETGAVTATDFQFSTDTITDQLLAELDCLETYRGDANVRPTIRQVAEHIIAAVPHLPAGITPDAQGRIPTSRLQECFEVGLEASLHDLENARGAAQIAQRRTLARMARDFQRSPNARTSQASTPSSTLPWREVWSTELGDNDAIVRALENAEPELAQLWRDEIASGGRTFSTLGDLIAALEDRNPQFVESAYRALTSGTSTQALTNDPHRVLYALLDQTREVMAETSAGGRRAAVRQTRTLEEREGIFRTSLETVESVSLRSREMSQDMERERRERIDAEARNAHAASTARVRH